MKKIPLVHNMFALVDDEDFEWLNRYKWRTSIGRDTYYAARNKVTKNGKIEGVLMHREILNVPRKLKTDHQDHNGLNNQRFNIRICTPTQNQMNMRKRENTSSKFKGVTWDKTNKKWRVCITINSKTYRLGRFQNEEKAARAYDEKAVELFGEFALTNKMMGLLDNG